MRWLTETALPSAHHDDALKAVAKRLLGSEAFTLGLPKMGIDGTWRSARTCCRLCLSASLFATTNPSLAHDDNAAPLPTRPQARVPSDRMFDSSS